MIALFWSLFHLPFCVTCYTFVKTNTKLCIWSQLSILFSYKTVQNEVLDSKPIDSSDYRNFFSRWLLKNLNYAKSNKKRTSYIHTHTHTCKILQFSYFEIIVLYSHHRCYKLYLFQNFSSIKFFLDVFILFVRA